MAFQRRKVVRVPWLSRSSALTRIRGDSGQTPAYTHIRVLLVGVFSVAFTATSCSTAPPPPADARVVHTIDLNRGTVSPVKDNYHTIDLGLSGDGQFLFVATDLNNNSSEIAVYTAPDVVLRTVIPVHGSLVNMAASRTDHTAYVATSSESYGNGANISVIDADRGIATANVSLAYSAHVTVGKDRNVYASDRDHVTEFDPLLATTLRSISISFPAGFDGPPVIIGSSHSSELCVIANGSGSASGSGSVSRLDVGTGTLSLAASLIDSVNDCIVGPNGTLYISGGNQLTRIDPGPPGKRRDIELSEVAYHTVLAPNNQRAYVTHAGSDTVSAVDLLSGRELGSIAVGKRPTDLGISPDGRHVYVVNSNSNSVSVIEIDKPSRRQGIPPAATPPPPGPTIGGPAPEPSVGVGGSSSGAAIDKPRPPAPLNPAPPTSAVTLAAFTGLWTGHTRSLTISASGLGHEHTDDGCCEPVIDLTFQLSNPQGTSPTHVTATATVTAVQIGPGWDPAVQPPVVGQHGTVSIDGGLITDHLSNTYFCNKAEDAKSTCGV